MTRPSIRATVVVLTAGTMLSVAGLVAAFVLRLAGAAAAADSVSYAAIAVLLATPAAGLAATVFETRRNQHWTATSALLVLAILAAATVVALSVQR
jgi:hypothetical protein